MRKNLRKLAKNTAGFTLTEVMIGIMILTVAIVTATNLLVGLISTNRNNVLTLQAYYLAQEGIEAVRNIRDTNWLHNDGFMGTQDGVFGAFEYGKSYGVFLRSEGWRNSDGSEVIKRINLRGFSPWEIDNGFFALGLNDDTGSNYYSKALVTDASDAKFYRHVEILPACEDEEECEDFMLVRSVVNWRDGTKERELHLDAVLSNWKGGAL